MNTYAPAPTVEGITLLSIEEYKVAEPNIPLVDDWWWLRSPGDNSWSAACVAPGGGVVGFGCSVGNVLVGVRPALRFNPKSAKLPIGAKVRVESFTWTHVTDGILLCDSIITRRMPFRKECKAEDANVYETSDVKKYLDKMFANIMVWQTVRDALGEMSYAFHTLHDHMKDHMPDYGCGNDAYALEVEESVANAYADFTRNEQKLKALIESL